MTAVGVLSLLFAGREVGTIRKANEEFPGFAGRFESLRDDASEPMKRVHDFIHECASSPSFDDEGWMEHVWTEEQEEKYLELAESDAWTLQDRETGEVIPILCPLFFSNGELTWRLGRPTRRP